MGFDTFGSIPLCLAIFIWNSACTHLCHDCGSLRFLGITASWEWKKYSANICIAFHDCPGTGELTFWLEKLADLQNLPWHFYFTVVRDVSENNLIGIWWDKCSCWCPEGIPVPYSRKIQANTWLLIPLRIFFSVCGLYVSTSTLTVPVWLPEAGTAQELSCCAK